MQESYVTKQSGAVSPVIGIWVSYTSWLTDSSHLDYTGVAQSVCST